MWNRSFLPDRLDGHRSRRITRMLAVAVATATAALGLGAASASAAVITVTLDGSAKGSVMSNPAGLNCSNVPGAEATDCSHNFEGVLSYVEFTAAGAEGAAFKGWGGGGTAGGTCLGATNPCRTGVVYGIDLQVTATFAPKPDRPVVATGAASDITFPSAVLSGTVNPNSAEFSVSDCYFEYGTSTDYGLRAPCAPAPASGTAAIPVTGRAGLLASATTYHYRVVAVSAGGRSVGNDQTFTSAAAPVDSCPNAAIRAQQGAIAQRLPDCYAYELVSPPSTAGEVPLAFQIGGPGDDVLFSSVGGFGDIENLTNLGAPYRARRTAVGWSTSAVGGPPAADFPIFINDIDWTADWSQMDSPLTLWRARPVASPSGSYQSVVGRKGGPWHPVTPTVAADTTLVATSTDLSGVLLRGLARPQLTDGSTDTRTARKASLILSTLAPDGTLDLRQVAKQDGATLFPACDLVLGTSTNGVTRGAVARDGLTRIVFSTSATGCTTAALQRVWVSEPFSSDPDAFDVSASRCTTACGTPQRVTFVGGSLDATRLYMTTSEKLLDADNQSGFDLYEYDFRRPTSERLRLVTGNDEPANVLGALAVSDDGTRVYFVARGRLSGAISGDSAPVPGAPNLYVRTTDQSGGNSVTRFVGTLSEDDSPLWSSTASHAVALTPDGRYLAFASQAALTIDKQVGDVLPDVYRLDADTGELLRAWTDRPEHNGVSRKAGAELSYRDANGLYGSREPARVGLRSIADDGSAIYFSSAEPLASSDVNDKDDAFVWKASTGSSMMMVSDGRDTLGVVPAGMSADGSSYFFSTASRLVAQHTSTSVGLYAVRPGGGFAVPEAPSAPCAGEGCQGPLTEPLVFPAVGSTALEGGGNVVPPGEVPPAGNAKLRVSKVKTVRGTSTRIKVRVPEKGKIRTSGSGLERATMSAKKAGTYRVTVRLSKRAQRKLKRTHRVRIPLTVQFTPAKGKPQRVRAHVTFKPEAKKHRKSSSRASRELNVLSSDVQKGR